jgi:hypothetical protein
MCNYTFPTKKLIKDTMELKATLHEVMLMLQESIIHKLLTLNLNVNSG